MAHPVTCHCGSVWPAGATACPRCGSADATVVAGPAPDQTITAGGPAGVPGGPPPEVPGYEVLGELGRGGMGVVYRARETSLKREVALKVLLSGAHAGPRDLARFRAEAEAAAAVQHPHVVPVFAVGQHAGLPFLAMELVPGESLAARLDRGPVGPTEAARVVEAVARGVAAAHERGILHRDLKPANILFAADGDPKVADFGLAKMGDTGLTVSGAVLGTPAYMAPEQARGDTRGLGPVTDVWALGAILYECLAGRPPFRGRSAPETFRLVCEADPEPLPGVPRDLATIALKCLEKDPANRYPSAVAVADDLARFRAGEPISARRRGALARVGRWVRRHPGPVYLGAGALLAAALVVAFYPPAEPEPPQPRFVPPPPPPVEPDDETGADKPGAVGRVRKAANRMNSQNNLKLIGIAVHNLHSTYDRFPADAIYDPKTGRALLSWRVAILPFIEHEPLYKQFKLDEPWDSPNNIRLLEKMPADFAIKNTTPPPGHTYYQAFTGPGTALDPAALRPGPLGKMGLAFTEFTDGTSDTILMAEAAKPVPWTKPEDLVVAPGRPLPALGGVWEGGYNVLMANGRVEFVSDRVSEATLRAALSPRANDRLGPDWPNGPKK